MKKINEIKISHQQFVLQTSDGKRFTHEDRAKLDVWGNGEKIGEIHQGRDARWVAQLFPAVNFKGETVWKHISTHQSKEGAEDGVFNLLAEINYFRK